MVALRKVLGPFGRQELGGRFGGEVKTVKYGFIAIRADHSTAHYSLNYDVETRAFTASVSHSRNVQTKHPNLFLGQGGAMVIEGLLVDILKSRLPPADIAHLTALSLLRR